MPGPSSWRSRRFANEGNIVDDLMRELNEIQTASVLRCDYDKTLALLRALKAGSVSLDNVTMTADGWTVAETEPVEDTEEPLDEGE
jgi:hypothetical protein